MHEIIRPNSLKTVPSGVANCRNLPFGGRATQDSRVRLPRKENARSRHQCLFEENVKKTGKKHGLRTLSEGLDFDRFLNGVHVVGLLHEGLDFDRFCRV